MIYYYLIQSPCSNSANYPSNFLCSYFVFLVYDPIQDHGRTHLSDFLCPPRSGPVSQLLHLVKLAILKNTGQLSCRLSSTWIF